MEMISIVFENENENNKKNRNLGSYQVQNAGALTLCVINMAF